MVAGSSFPSSLDVFTTKVDGSDDILAVETNTQSSAIEKLQTKVGIDNSVDTTSLDYKVNSVIDLTGTSDGMVLTVDDALTNGFGWKVNAAGFVDPMTTRGDIIVRDVSNDTNRLAVGTVGKILTSDGTDISWSDPASQKEQLENILATQIFS